METPTMVCNCTKPIVTDGDYEDRIMCSLSLMSHVVVFLQQVGCFAGSVTEQMEKEPNDGSLTVTTFQTTTGEKKDVISCDAAYKLWNHFAVQHKDETEYLRMNIHVLVKPTCLCNRFLLENKTNLGRNRELNQQEEAAILRAQCIDEHRFDFAMIGQLLNELNNDICSSLKFHTLILDHSTQCVEVNRIKTNCNAFRGRINNHYCQMLQDVTGIPLAGSFWQRISGTDVVEKEEALRAAAKSFMKLHENSPFGCSGAMCRIPFLSAEKVDEINTWKEAFLKEE